MPSSKDKSESQIKIASPNENNQSNVDGLVLDKWVFQLFWLSIDSGKPVHLRI